MRKRNFFFLEILLALLLVVSASLFIVKNGHFFVRAEISSLEQIECERIADLAFCSLKKKLYQNQIAWKDFSSEKKSSPKEKFEERFFLNLSPLCPKREVEVFYRIQTKEEKAQQEKLFRLLKIEIFLKAPFFKTQGKKKKNPRGEKTFSYSAVVCKNPQKA